MCTEDAITIEKHPTESYDNPAFEPDPIKNNTKPTKEFSNEGNPNSKGKQNVNKEETKSSAEARRDTMETARRRVGVTSKPGILKNLFVISLGFLLLFTAVMSLSNLESSLNPDLGLGVISLSVVYGSLALSSLFLPTAVINCLGLKKTVAFSMLCYTPYFVVNLFPSWYNLIPTACIMGIGGATLWTAKCSYVTELANRYAALTDESNQIVLARFFGIFFMIFQSSQIWGNLIAYRILKPQTGAVNATLLAVNVPPSSCGVAFKDLPPKTTDSSFPDSSQIHLLCGIFITCSILGALVILLWLDDLDALLVENQEDEVKSSLFIQTLKQLGRPRQMALVPLTVFNGMLEGFIFGDFTEAYVTCGWSIDHVGYVMIAFGVVNAFCSYAYGPATKALGRFTVLTSGLLLSLASLALMFLWKPEPHRRDLFYLFFVAAALMGSADALWSTQLSALHGSFFPESRDAAFSNHRMWHSIGYVISFGYSSSLDIPIKLYILLGALILGYSSYLALDIHRLFIGDKEKEKRTEKDNATLCL